ncbi:hypothetical protein C8R44DRAFT_797443 [Mycena epipterygia]|nr:hypothetical protein C8R44DRAFT_797443 [Mycena epipterygia]
MQRFRSTMALASGVIVRFGEGLFLFLGSLAADFVLEVDAFADGCIYRLGDDSAVPLPFPPREGVTGHSGHPEKGGDGSRVVICVRFRQIARPSADGYVMRCASISPCCFLLVVLSPSRSRTFGIAPLPLYER